MSISIFIFDILLPLGQPSTKELASPKEREKKTWYEVFARGNNKIARNVVICRPLLQLVIGR
jgi:hypothetical protein